MPVSHEVRARCQALLDDGERIDYLIPSSAIWFGTLLVGADSYVVVTDRRIVVLMGGFFRRGRPREVNVAYPRSTRLGPVEFAPEPQITFGGRVYEIDDHDVPAVRAADAELDAGSMPDDPFADPSPDDHSDGPAADRP